MLCVKGVVLFGVSFARDSGFVLCLLQVQLQSFDFLQLRLIYLLLRGFLRESVFQFSFRLFEFGFCVSELYHLLVELLYDVVFLRYLRLQSVVFLFYVP